MNTKPNRTWVVLGLALVFTLVAVIVGLVMRENEYGLQISATASAVLAANNAVLTALSATEVAARPTATSTTYPSATPLGIQEATTTPPAPPYEACAFQWAHQDLPDVTKAAQQALEAAGLIEVTVRADPHWLGWLS